MTELLPGDRVKVTAHRGGSFYFSGRTGKLIAFRQRTWAGYGGYWAVALDDGYQYALYEEELTRLEEETMAESKKQTIEIDFKFDVDTIVSNVRLDIAKSLRALADEIEERSA